MGLADRGLIDEAGCNDDVNKREGEGVWVIKRDDVERALLLETLGERDGERELDTGKVLDDDTWTTVVVGAAEAVLETIAETLGLVNPLVDVDEVPEEANADSEALTDEVDSTEGVAENRESEVKSEVLGVAAKDEKCGVGEGVAVTRLVLYRTTVLLCCSVELRREMEGVKLDASSGREVDAWEVDSRNEVGPTEGGGCDGGPVESDDDGVSENSETAETDTDMVGVADKEETSDSEADGDAMLSVVGRADTRETDEDKGVNSVLE